MSQMPLFTGHLQIPSMNTVLEGVEIQPWWGKWEQQVWVGDTISGAARDAGNTVNTLLRPGLLLGKITASGLLKEWNPTGTDGSEVIVGVLGAVVNAQQSGSNQQRYVGFIQVGGNVYSNRLIIPGNAAEGIVGDALEYQVIQQLQCRFLLDRHLTYAGANGPSSAKFRYLTAAEITADAVTVLASEHGRTFLMTGADGNTTFTLPAAKVGLTYHFFNNVATHNLVFALASGSIKLADADGTATAATLQPGESCTMIGTAAGVYQMYAATEATTD